MKKFQILLAAAALMTVAACTQKEDFPEPVPGTSYVLEGTVATPGFTWETMSSVGLYSAMPEVKAQNLECKIEGWAATNLIDAETGEKIPYTPSKYEGEGTACFNTPALDLVKGENSFLVYTPYDAELTYLNGVIYGLEVAQDQKMPTVNVASPCFAYGDCKGIPGVDKTFKFELNPACAMAKISVTSDEFAAKGYGLSKVTIFDKEGTAALGGAFDVNIEKGEAKTLESYSKVATTITKTVALTSGAEQNAYIQIMPGDFTGKELCIVLEFTGAAGKVTIPVTKNDLKFNVGETTEIKIENVKASDCSIPWYCAEESRLTSGEGYAYGDANTYFIQCKNGQTWNGATYAENSEIPNEVTIDFRARGDFFSAVDPTGAEFEWFKTKNGTVYTPRVADYAASNVTIDGKFSFTVNAANYTVTVKNEGAFAGAPILLMKKDGKVLWAWTFWNVAADGTKIEPVQVGDYKLANLSIGQPTTNYEKWVANKTSASNPDPVFRFTNLYQWGRPMPIYWTTYWTLDYINGSGTGNVPAIEGGNADGPTLTFAQTLEMPVGLIVARPDDVNLPHIHSSANRASIWGAPAGGDVTKLKPEEAKGTKSIYDPCPKGWRIADYYALDALVSASKTVNRDNGTVGYMVNGVLFENAGYGNGKTTASAGGRLATMGGGNTGKVANCGHGVFWSNYLGSDTSNQPKAYYANITASADSNKMASYNGSISAPVRCQLDEENR